MSKAIIIIDDTDEAAEGGFSIKVEFDPPAPESEEERSRTPVPDAARIALFMVEQLEQAMGIAKEEAQKQEDAE